MTNEPTPAEAAAVRILREAIVRNASEIQLSPVQGPSGGVSLSVSYKASAGGGSVAIEILPELREAVLGRLILMANCRETDDLSRACSGTFVVRYEGETWTFLLRSTSHELGQGLSLTMIHGETCSFCGSGVLKKQGLAFPWNFAANEADPLHCFNGLIVHQGCVAAHPLRREAQARLALWRGVDRCFICGKAAGLGKVRGFGTVALSFLTENRDDPLYAFNYARFDTQCLPDWPGSDELCRRLQDLVSAGKFQGGGLEHFLNGSKTQWRND